MLPFHAKLKFFSISPLPFPYFVGNHIHNIWEIVYYTKGIGESILEGKKLLYEPNTYVIIPPGTQHAEKSLTEGNHIICFGFESTSEEDALPLVLFKDAAPHPILSLLNKIEQEIKKANSYYEEIVSALLQEIFFLSKRTLTNKIFNADSRINMICDYIDNYYTTDIDLNRLAENFFYSYDYLRHLFRKKTGMGLKKYILKKRIDLAKQLLSKKLPIAEIAKQCGFYSSSHFSSCFIENTGQTPSQYRKFHSFQYSSWNPYVRMIEDQKEKLSETSSDFMMTTKTKN